MTGRKKIVYAVIATVVVAWGLRVMWARHLEKQQASSRKAEYETSLALARRTIPLGTSRGNLRALAKSRGLVVTETQFDADGLDDLLVEVGKEPSPRWFCAYEGVYLDFKFPSISHRRSDEDLAAPLQAIDLFYWSRDCL